MKLFIEYKKTSLVRFISGIAFMFSNCNLFLNSEVVMNLLQHIVFIIYLYCHIKSIFMIFCVSFKGWVEGEVLY